jgi:hypothetical protein
MFTLPSLPGRMNSAASTMCWQLRHWGTHLHDTLVPVSGGEHGVAFIDGLGERLLNIHILPGLAGQDGG